MHRLTSRLMLYSPGPGSILSRVSCLCRRFAARNYDRETLASDVLIQIRRLLELSREYGLEGNLWHGYLAFLLATEENPFSLSAEKADPSDDSLADFAKQDLDIFCRLFAYDFSDLEKALGLDCFTALQNYRSGESRPLLRRQNAGEKIRLLCAEAAGAKDGAGLFRILSAFYRDWGVGLPGLNKAFRLSRTCRSGREAESFSSLLVPVAADNVFFSDLTGCREQKKQLTENTEAFLRGCPANNVLLFGEAGTGKSTSVKALLNEYYPMGLRMIEICRHEIRELPRILNAVRARRYHFILFMDDLSFEESESDYKYLKAVIEGGLESRPENVLIYAASNRRHIVRETWADREDVRGNDTMQEKQSLADRFGIVIGYYRPSQEEYFDIVRDLARKRPEIRLSEEALLEEARRWELRHGGRSGRTARQLIDFLSGRPPQGSPLPDADRVF